MKLEKTYKKIITKFVFLIFLLTGEIFAQIKPIEKSDFNLGKAELGKDIFFDERFSRNQKISCNTCHDLNVNFSGSSKIKIQTNRTLSVLNSANNYFFFNDARFTNLKDVIKYTFLNEYFLNSNEQSLVKKIETNPKYKKAFEKIYKNINFENIVDSMENFLISLNTLNSEFDQYLRGNKELNKKAKKGYEIFLKNGCINCHNGVNLGSNLIINKNDFLNFDIYKSKSKIIKVPNLRNLTKMPFYKKNKDFITKNIKIMSYATLQHELNEDEIFYIIKFLESLNGEKPEILNE